MGIIYFDTADPNDPSTQLSISYEEGDIVSITKAWKKLKDLWDNGVIQFGEYVNASISLGHFDILNKLNNDEINEHPVPYLSHDDIISYFN